MKKGDCAKQHCSRVKKKGAPITIAKVSLQVQGAVCRERGLGLRFEQIGIQIGGEQ